MLHELAHDIGMWVIAAVAVVAFSTIAVSTQSLRGRLSARFWRLPLAARVLLVAAAAGAFLLAGAWAEANRHGGWATWAYALSVFTGLFLLLVLVVSAAEWREARRRSP
jgi:O-antigen/teichoic acid export membrane protein